MLSLVSDPDTVTEDVTSKIASVMVNIAGLFGKNKKQVRIKF